MDDAMEDWNHRKFRQHRASLEDSPDAITLPEKSKDKYLRAYNDFNQWKITNGLHPELVDEPTILKYITELSSNYKPSTLWAQYSMLRSTIAINKSIDISKYPELTSYLKNNSKGYQVKQSKVFTEQQITKFLDEAPDSQFLATKVMLVMGLCGACRRDDLHSMKLSDIEDKGGVLLVKVPSGWRKPARTFAVSGHFYDIYRKYRNLRPQNCNHDKFFVNYSNGKCTKSPIGVQTIGFAPKQIAKYLELPDSDSYTGHCFRRSSTSMFEEPKEKRNYEEEQRLYKEKRMRVRAEMLRDMGENSNSRMSDDFNPLTPAFVSINEDCAFVNPLTRDDLKDHIPEITKCTYHMSRLCAACKWSVRLYYSGEDQPQEIRATNGQNGSTPGQLLDSPYNLVHTMNQDQQIVFVNTNTAPQVYTPTKSAGDGRYLEPGPHFSPTFTAGTNKELKWEIRLDHKDGDFYARLNFLELKGSLRYDYKISYLKKNLQEQIIRDFSNVYSNDSSTKDVQLPRGLQLRFAKSTLVLIVCIVTETDHLSSDPIKTEMDDEDNDDIVSVDGEVSEAAQELEVMYEKGLLTDVTLHVEGQSIAAHKYILAARSRVFLEMFTNGEQEVNPEIEIEDLTYFSAREMMKFFYTGHLRDVEEEVARQLMITANKYGIKLLFSKCETILADCLNVDNVVDLFKLADSSNAEELKLKAKEFLIKNIKSVPGDMLSTLNSNFLTEILLEVTKRQN